MPSERYVVFFLIFFLAAEMVNVTFIVLKGARLASALARDVDRQSYIKALDVFFVPVMS